jgi:hypothetical protein
VRDDGRPRAQINQKPRYPGPAKWKFEAGLNSYELLAIKEPFSSRFICSLLETKHIVLWDEVCCFACRLEARTNLIVADVQRRKQMLETIIVVLLVLWLLGFGFHVFGSLIHILLVLAIIVVVIRVLRGRPAV